VRKPPDAQYPNLPGPIDYVVQTQTNVGDITTSGIDLNLRWQGPATPLGQLSFNIDATYVLDYRHEGFASLSDASGVGARPQNAAGVIARYRHYAHVDWTSGAWGATLANTYQSGYRECDLFTFDPDTGVCPGTRHVASYTVWDLQGRYTGLRNATFSLGVRNLFDRAPPVSTTSATSGTFQAGIDPTYGDPRGRMYYAAIRYVFK
jgi:iron complex outermembrane receptor protein